MASGLRTRPGRNRPGIEIRRAGLRRDFQLHDAVHSERALRVPQVAQADQLPVACRIDETVGIDLAFARLVGVASGVGDGHLLAAVDGAGELGQRAPHARAFLARGQGDADLRGRVRTVEPWRIERQLAKRVLGQFAVRQALGRAQGLGRQNQGDTLVVVQFDGRQS